MEIVDVLVVGAGPTGMMMAAELARYGLNCRIIDRGLSYGDTSRAVAIQARTLEIFNQLGLADIFLSQGLPLKGAVAISETHEVGHLSFEKLPSPYPFILSLEQTKTERILGDYVTSQGVTIEREQEFIHLEQIDDAVHVLIKNIISGEEKWIKTHWVVGCDGAHSQVRKQLNFSFEGKFFEDIFSIADVHVHWKHPHQKVFAFLNPKGILAALPLPDPNRYRLIFQLTSFLKGERREPTLQEVEGLLQEYAGADVKVTDPIWFSNFHINSRMANTYRKERVFLAGDAAHIHSPVGGQGMNTGLQDSFNLAWKLALVHKKKAFPKLLDTYDLERHNIGRKLLKATEKASFFATLHSPFAIWLRNKILSFLFCRQFFQSFMPKILSQIALQYPKSAVVVETAPFRKGPKAGQRAPNCPFVLNKTSTNLYSLMQNPKVFYLLIFKGKKSIDLTLNSSLKSEIILPIFISYGEKDQSYCDPCGVAHKIYGSSDLSIYLIRPDGYIAYRSFSFDITQLNSVIQDILIL